MTLVVSAGDDTVEENLDISVIEGTGEVSWLTTAVVVATIALIAMAVALVAIRARRGAGN